MPLRERWQCARIPGPAVTTEGNYTAMRKLAATIGTAAVAAGLILGTSGTAFANSDDHSDDHSNYSRTFTPSQCAERHSLNLDCNNIHVIELGNIF
jgi:hypothetical protein